MSDTLFPFFSRWVFFRSNILPFLFLLSLMRDFSFLFMSDRRKEASATTWQRQKAIYQSITASQFHIYLFIIYLHTSDQFLSIFFTFFLHWEPFTRHHRITATRFHIYLYIWLILSTFFTFLYLFDHVTKFVWSPRTMFFDPQPNLFN